MDFLATQRASRNANGVMYVNGAAYGREKRIEVADAYMLGMDQQVPLETKRQSASAGGKGEVSRGAREEERQPLREEETKRRSIATPGEGKLAEAPGGGEAAGSKGGDQATISLGGRREERGNQSRRRGGGS